MDHSNSLCKIHVNNWLEVSNLWLAEFGASTSCCTPINQTASVQFTVDHEEMGAGAWSLVINSCGLPSEIDLINIPPPPPPIAGVTFTPGGRGGSGTIVGAFFGAAVLGILKDGFTLSGVSAYTFDIILGIAILVTMLINVRLSRLREAGGG